MELLDLYTKDRILTGKTVKRGEKVPEGYYGLVVHVCVFNSKGEMLIQKRSPQKELFGNLWDITAGGCVISGEKSEDAAHRELFEELGIDVSFKNIRPSMTIHYEDGFDDLYMIVRDVNTQKVKLQSEEVSAVKWATKEEILSMIEDGTFIPYFKEKISYLFAVKDYRGVFVPKGYEYL